MAKKFDAVAWMRSRREQIDAEDQGLTWEEKAKKTKELLEGDPLMKRFEEAPGVRPSGSQGQRASTGRSPRNRRD